MKPKFTPTRYGLPMLAMPNSLLLFSFLLLFLISSTEVHAQLPLFDDFETGWGNWLDGGNDCTRNNNASLNGSFHVRLRDDSGTSNTYSNAINLSSYTSVTIDFIYRSNNYSGTEDFFVEFSNNNGASWTQIGQYVYGTDFFNNTTYNPSITIDNATYSFSANSRFRFRANGATNTQRVRIDDISIFDPSAVTYCSTIDFTSDVEPMTNVTFNTIDNTTSATVNGTPALESFSASISTNVMQSSSYTITVEGNTAGAFTNYFTAFIDWNQNGTLDDTGEVFPIGTIFNSTGADGQTASVSIPIPATALLGATRMRVVKNFGASPTDPCAVYDYGQAEDYEIVVQAATPCTEPTAQPTALTFTTITDTQIDGSFTAASPASDNYLVVYNTSGTTPNPSDTTTYTIGGSIGSSIIADNDNDTTFSVTGLTPGTTYYFYVFSFNSFCTGGPDYLATSPLTGNETTDVTPVCSTIDFTSDVEPITNVTFGTIDNTTSEVLNGTPALEDFTSSVTPAIVDPGSTYTISLEGNTVGGFTNYFTVFFDWNQNGVLDEIGEVYRIGYIFNSTGVDGMSITQDITIPVTASMGNTTMRVVKNYDVYAIDPCASYDYGQAEDYIITVQGSATCVSPTDAPTSLTLSANDTLISGSFTAASSNPDSYLVVYSTNSTAPTPPVDGTTYNLGDQIDTGYFVADNDANTYFTVSGLTASTTYYFFIYSKNQGCNSGPLHYSTPLTGNAATIASGYCIPESINDEADLYINHLEFIGTLNDVQNLNNGYSPYSPVGYQDWTALPNSIQAQGEGINVFWESLGGRGHFKAWIDWNQDNSFDNVTELVYDTGSIGTSSSTFGFEVPAAQATGDYRMRIKLYRFDIDNFSDDSTPCEDLDTGHDTYGETEDYTFTVIESCPSIISAITEGNECNEADGDVQVDLTVTGTSGTTEFRWYDAEVGGNLVATTSADGSFMSTYSPNLSATTSFYVTAYNGSCESLYRTRLRATVRESSSISFTPNTIETCGEADIIEVSVSAVNETVFLIEEYFESGLGSFTVNNILTNSAAEDAATEWQVESSTFIPTLEVWFPAISSGFSGNQFAMATSDYNSTNPIETAIESGVIDTSNMLDLTLNFDMYFSRYLSSIPEAVYVDVSTDGGTNWTVFQTFDDDIGYGTAFDSQSLDLSTYLDETNFKVRFRYYASAWCDGVAIDNVELFGERPVQSTFTWDDGGNNYVNFYTDAATTIPYVYPNYADTVYIQLTNAGLQQASFTLDITADLTNGCQVTESVPLTNSTKTWNGTAGNTDWFDPNNWSPVGVPDSDTCVIVPDAGIQPSPVIGPPSNTTPAYAYNVLVQNNGVLNVQEDQTLTVTNTVTVETNGDFNIDDSGSLIQIDNVANSGDITMDRTASIRRTDYVYWSSPVNGFNIEDVSTNTPSGHLYEWNPTFDRPDGPPPTSVPNNYGQWESASGAMSTAKGYIVRGPTGHPSTPTDFTATFDGVPNNGDISIAITRGTYTGADYLGPGATNITSDDDNWNLIGNPYPSAISAIDFLTEAANSNIDGVVYLWTHGIEISDTNPDPFYDDYVYNYNVADYVAYNSSGVSSPVGFNGNIGAGQGFYVRMNDDATTSETVSFNNSMRSNTYNNDQFFRVSGTVNRTTNTEAHRIWLDMVTPSGNTNTALIAYITGATNGNDRMFDAVSTAGEGLNIFSLINSDPYIIQGRQLPFDENDLVPIGVNINEPGIQTIAINELQGLFSDDNQNIYLEDLYTGIIHNIKGSPYTFTTEGGIFNDRFVLRFTNETLGIDDVQPKATIKVYEEHDQLVVNSDNQNIEAIEVYDVLGRKLFIKKDISNPRFIITSLQKSNNAIFLKVTLDNGRTQNIKLIY